jgi:Ca2+-binding EF-hand superfamily protein
MSPKAAKAFVDQLRQFDENEDGAIAKSELPGRLHTVIDTHDKNKNGSLDKDELDLIGQNSGANETGGRSGPPRDRGPSGPQDGGPGGPPSPADLVTEAMSFDANKDGKLDQDELMKFAEELQHRGPPGSQNGGSQRGGGQGQDRSRGRPRG